MALLSENEPTRRAESRIAAEERYKSVRRDFSKELMRRRQGSMTFMQSIEKIKRIANDFLATDGEHQYNTG